MNFLDRLLFYEFTTVGVVAQLVNQFHFYLTENNFIATVINIFKETNNMVLINQERNNLMKDYVFLNEKLPSVMVVGFLQVDLREVKEQYV
jgi:hypothetical protein